MKLVNDKGEIVGEYSDDDGFMVFTENGAVAVLPNKDDNSLVPDHILMTAATMLYLSDREGRAAIEEFWATKTRNTH